jgi:hypothetical protein
MRKSWKRVPIVAKVSLALMLTTAPSVASACDSWDLSGPFTISQSNKLTVTGTFEQAGGQLKGTASYFSPTLGDHGTWLDGNVTGSVGGDSVQFSVTWYGSYVTCSSECVGSSYDASGEYEGSILADGRMSGLNWATGDPGHKVSWNAAEAASCRPPAPIADRAVIQAMQSSGVAKIETPIRPDSKFVERGGGIAGAGPVRTDSKFVEPRGGIAGAVAPGALGVVTAVPTCRSGYVWREARPEDHACVTPESRSLAAQENAAAASRVNPQGAYGPNTCVSGFVWREAFDGDVVCVTPERRTAVREENGLSASRTQ